MRKYIKKQLLELIESLVEAHKQLETADISDENFMNILADLQEVAVVIGNQIDETEGENTKAVTLLEEYCEMLFKMSRATNAEELNHDLADGYKLLLKVSEEVKQFVEQLDVVFLPYKASMWDCMETVWRAACKDPGCNVYVIPIPYYDRNKDGSLAKMHYEGELLPDYVKITSYREYLLPGRHPEVVYIHNPFDEYNHVTCVHPDFFSAKLQKETDMLVYIPYYLMGKRLDESHSLLPAYLYADKIVLKDEKLAEDIDASIPREKFVLAGCPKQERMIWMETHRDELPIPADWKAKIQNRKVVFYNVSISGLLKDKELMLDKMEEVLSIVEKRPEIVLLYRPHPLAESTMSSMCPELLPKYLQLTDKVKQMENGIYDTTADAGISVALSDAYIGEFTSSVVDMFKAVHKPVFYLTKEQYYQPAQDELLAERMYDVCRVGDDLWFVTNLTQMLCKYDLKDNVIEYVTDIPETGYGKTEYAYIVHHDGKLIIVPSIAPSLCIYDIQKKTFRKDYFKEEGVNALFGRAFLVDNYLYLTPASYPAIVRYDILSGTYEYYKECISEISRLIPDVYETTPFSWGADIHGDELFLASSKANVMVIFNIRNLSYQVVRFGEESNNCIGMTVDDEYCWMIQADSADVIRWSRRDGQTKLYAGPDCDFEGEGLPYINIIDMGERLHLIPHRLHHIYVMDKRSGAFSYADRDIEADETMQPSKLSVDTGICADFGKKISDTEFVMETVYDYAIHVYDVQSGAYQKCPIRLGDRTKLEAEKIGVSKLQEVREANWMPLDKYLSYVAEDLLKVIPRIGLPGLKLDENLRTGEMIHREICDSVLRK